MKTKFNKIILCVIAFSMCVFSLSFGIYAVMSAKMNTAITVGYMAYNCSANISAVITGASTEAEGEIADITLDTVAVNGKNKQTANMDFGTFYFTTIGTKNALGKSHPIKIWFTIQNTSDFDICVDVSLPTITDVEVVADKMSHAIKSGETDTIMVTLTVTNANTTALESSVSSTDLSLTLRKFLKTKADISVYKDSTVTHFENHPYYIKFGCDDDYGGSSYDIYWLIGGTIDENGQTVALKEEDKTQLDTGKLDVNTDYYIICASSLYLNNDFDFIPYQNNFYYGTDMRLGSYLLEYPSITNVTDYSLSTTRQYLTNHTVYGGIQDTTAYTYTPDTSIVSQNPLELYNLDDSFIYPLIQRRNLSAIYKTLGYGNTELTIPTDLADNLSINEADAFWIPTNADISVLGDDFIAYKYFEETATIDPFFTFTHGSSSHCQSITRWTDKGSVSYIAHWQSTSNSLGIHKYRPAFIL